MLFTNYKEIDMDIVYCNTIRSILLKQNMKVEDGLQLNLPKTELYFVFDKVEEISYEKIYNHMLLLWLITGLRPHLIVYPSQLRRGKRYFKFIITIKVDFDSLTFVFFDFLVNIFNFLLEKGDTRKYDNFSKYYCEIKNLELFSNIRLSRSFYTQKINDTLFIKFYYRKSRKFEQILKVEQVLGHFKII